MTIGGEVTAPVVIKRVQPKWPEAVARQHQWVFSLVVTRTGLVRDVQLIHGTRGTYARLAEDAIKEWKFKPGTYRGKPVDVRYNLSVTIHVR